MSQEDSSSELTPKLIDALYVEAMLLADEARSYFDHSAREDRLGLDAVDRVGFSCESLKVTTRLMHIIAWLLNQRAVGAGEITQAEASHRDRRIGDSPPTDETLIMRLPDKAAEIIRASEELHSRIERLDRMGTPTEATVSPARGLLSRLERSF